MPSLFYRSINVSDKLENSSECSKCPGIEREKCGANNHIALYEKGKSYLL
jgi:hypothetical protein